MQIFNRDLLKNLRLFIQMIAVAGLVTACLKPKQKDEVSENVMRHHNQETNASFYIGREISGEGFDNHSLEGWSIPLSRFYTFRACLSDRITNSRIIGHDFEVIIDSESQRSTLETTDDEGCLSWEEHLPFNYFATQSRYITIERQIKATGIHSGVRSFQLAINPWRNSRRDSAQEVIDLSKKSLPETQRLVLDDSKNFMSQQFLQQGPIEVRDLSLQIDVNQVLEDGNELEMRMSFTPRVVVKNLLGDNVIMNLRDGQFDLYAQVVGSSTSDDKVNLSPITSMIRVSNHDKDNAKELIFNGDRVDINVKVPIHRFMTSGHYELVFRLLPRDVSGLQPFYGVYRIGEHHQLIGSRGGLRPRLSSIETPDKLNDFDDLLAKSDGIGLDSRELEPFYFGHQSIRFLQVMADETTTQRTIAYSSRVCSNRTIDGRRAQYEEFTIIRDNGTTHTVNTEFDGCFNWIDTVTHQYYQPERYFEKVVTVRHNRSGSEQQLVAVMNPWDYGWTLGRDRRTMTQEEIDRVNHRDAPGSQLFLAGFGYETIRFRYEVDEFLNLQVKKAILLDVTPRVLRYNSITIGRNATEPLRDGVYLLKAAVQKDYYDPRTEGMVLKKHPEIKGSVEIENATNREVEYISAIKKLVRVKYGRIITPLEFSVNDLRLMRLRSNFLIEISPIDEAALGITPDLSITELDPASIQDQIEEMTLEERRQPRRKQQGSYQVEQGTLVEEERFFTELPFDVHNNSVRAAEREEERLNNLAPGDIDRLIALDSGLPSRTFVGPIILLSNNFGAGLRPTDELTEVTCTTIDCDFLKIDEVVPAYDYDPEVAKFYGSAKHLHNITVTELIERQKVIQLEYKNQQTYESLMGRYIEEFYLDYVSLKDKPIKSLSPMGKSLHADKNRNMVSTPSYFTELAQMTCGSDLIEDCLVEEHSSVTTKDDLLRIFNADYRESLNLLRYHSLYDEFTQEDLKQLITTQEDELDPTHYGDRLCYLWTHYMMSERINVNPYPRDFDEERYYRIIDTQQSRDYMVAFARCQRSIARNGIENVFSFSNILKPNGMDQYNFLGGKSMNFNVGTSFSMNYGESMSSAASADFDPIGGIIKSIGGKIGSALGIFGLKVGWNASESRSIGEGVSVASGTYLAMQRATMDIYFTEYERCREIRLKPDFYISERSFLQLQNHIPEHHLDEAYNQGILLCTGELEHDEEPRREMYYYFTQHFTEGDMLDNGDLLNHPWLLSLRGERDYAHFIDLIQATPDYTIESRDFDLKWITNDVLLHHYLGRSDEILQINESADLGNRPIDQLVNAYHLMPPTFPGIYFERPLRLDYPSI